MYSRSGSISSMNAQGRKKSVIVNNGKHFVHLSPKNIKGWRYIHHHHHHQMYPSLLKTESEWKTHPETNIQGAQSALI
jgi:hypothetical protein